MKDILVGYTGFVGTNIVEEHNFEGLYNSKNIEKAFGTNPELLVYSGVPSAMFLANNFPEKDFEIIKKAMANIKNINPKCVVLISTIAVYDNPVDIDENVKININKLTTYGKNRLLLEQFSPLRFKPVTFKRVSSLLFDIRASTNFVLEERSNEVIGLYCTINCHKFEKYSIP